MRATQISRATSMAIFVALLALSTASISTLVAADPDSDQPDCTVTHPTSKKFFDLRPLMRESGDDWTPDTDSDQSTTFKLNVCHTVLHKELDVKDPSNIASWGKRNKGTSLGQLSKAPFFKGDALLLEYKNGDECYNAPNYKKSTTIRFICDPSISGQGNPHLLANNDDCHFWFEWRTPAACPTERRNSGSGGGVMGIIIGVVIAVYFIGGVAYNRVVHHARGLKQIPNYQTWVNGFEFIKDMAIIVFANCYRPKRSQTYHNLPVDSEINTLIDDDYEDDEV